MKKKILFTVLLSLSLTVMTGCSNTVEPLPEKEENVVNADGKDEVEDSQEGTETPEPVEEEPEETQSASLSDTASEDGITITIDSCSFEPYEDSEGKYDRKMIVNYTIQNDTDFAYGYTPMAWEGELPDGYALKSWSDIMTLDLMQVQSHGQATGTAHFLIEPSLSISQVNLYYGLMDYDKEFWDDFGRIMTGEMGQDEYMSKYGSPKILEFTVEL